MAVPLSEMSKEGEGLASIHHLFEAGLRVLWDVFKVLLFVFSSY